MIHMTKETFCAGLEKAASGSREADSRRGKKKRSTIKEKVAFSGLTFNNTRPEGSLAGGWLEKSPYHCTTIVSKRGITQFSGIFAFYFHPS